METSTSRSTTTRATADEGNPDKIEANLNFGMATAKQNHCIIHPQILPNLLDHAIKKELDTNHAPVVIGVILGRVDGKIIEISNCFPMSLKSDKDSGDAKKSDDKSNSVIYIDKEYLKKMIKFHKTINKTEAILGVYVSSTTLDPISVSVILYFRDLFINNEVRSNLQQPIVLQFDPTLANNKLDIKVSLKLNFCSN